MTFPRSRDFAVRCPCAEEQVQTVTATVETRRLGFAQETLKRTRLFFFTGNGQPRNSKVPAVRCRGLLSFFYKMPHQLGAVELLSL